MMETLGIKVTLLRNRAMVWRRLWIAADMQFAALHEVLQVAFGWQGTQPFAFHHEMHKQAETVVVMLRPTTTVNKALHMGPVRYQYGEAWHLLIELESDEELARPLPHIAAGRGSGLAEDGSGARLPLDLDALNAELARGD